MNFKGEHPLKFDLTDSLYIENPHPNFYKNLHHEGQTINGILIKKKLQYRDGNHYLWEMQCHCSKTFYTRLSRIIDGTTKGCGCLRMNPETENVRTLESKLKEEYNTYPYHFVKSMQSNNTSGYKGVSYDKLRNKWRGYIQVAGKSIQKYCSSKEEAIAWRKQKEKELHEPLVKDMLENHAPKKTLQKLTRKS